jgi:hypothetical protein
MIETLALFVIVFSNLQPPIGVTVAGEPQNFGHPPIFDAFLAGPVAQNGQD